MFFLAGLPPLAFFNVATVGSLIFGSYGLENCFFFHILCHFLLQNIHEILHRHLFPAIHCVTLVPEQMSIYEVK